MMVYGYCIQKGGSGKTTSAVNTAAALAKMGKRVLLVDLDPQGNASLLLGSNTPKVSIHDALLHPHILLSQVIVPTPIAGVDLAPAHLALSTLEVQIYHQPGREKRLKEKLVEVSGNYDVTIVDTPPSLGLLPILALVAANVAIIPLACQELAVHGLAQEVRTIEEVSRRSNRDLKKKILLTLADHRAGDAEGAELSTRARYGSEVFSTVIPFNAITSRGLSNRDKGGAVVCYAASTAGALAYCALADELEKETLPCG